MPLLIPRTGACGEWLRDSIGSFFLLLSWADLPFSIPHSYSEDTTGPAVEEAAESTAFRPRSLAFLSLNFVTSARPLGRFQLRTSRTTLRRRQFPLRWRALDRRGPFFFFLFVSLAVEV